MSCMYSKVINFYYKGNSLKHVHYYSAHYIRNFNCLCRIKKQHWLGTPILHVVCVYYSYIMSVCVYISIIYIVYIHIVNN